MKPEDLAAPCVRLSSGRAAERSPVPALFLPPCRRQLLLSGLWIVVAALLLAAAAQRVSQQVERLHWWIPVALLIGVALADFASGVMHWAADTWGRAGMPMVGERVLLPFRVHHVNPDDILRRSFLDANGDVAALTIPALIALLFVPVHNEAGQIVSVAGTDCCAVGMLTNQSTSGRTGRRRRGPSACCRRSGWCSGQGITPGTTPAPLPCITASPPDGATLCSKPRGSSGGSKRHSPRSRGSGRGRMKPRSSRTIVQG
jgi:hypothetical protein